MALILSEQMHNISQATRGKGDLVFYILSMILLTFPLLFAWIRVKDLEKRMRKMGADESIILLEQKEVYGNLILTYLVIGMCLGSVADIIH